MRKTKTHSKKILLKRNHAMFILFVFIFAFCIAPLSFAQICDYDEKCDIGETRDNCVDDCLQLSPQEQAILDGADQRIEQYRKGDANLTIVYPNGAPVIGADVQIEQREHEFLFGANHSYGMWDEILYHQFGIETPFFSGRDHPILTGEELNIHLTKYNDYLAQFNAFANYVPVPTSWGKYEPENNNFLNEYFVQFNNFLKSENNKIRAVGLVWNAWTPDWVPEDCSRLIEEHEEEVRHIISNFKEDYPYITVVNELAIAATRKDEPFFSDKITQCIREMGDTVEAGDVKWAKKWFKVAREEAPNAKLLINEVAWSSPNFRKLLNELVDEKGRKLYDSIGIQSHMFVQVYPLDWLWEICEESSKFGAPVQFTETTVLSGTPMTSTTWDAADFGKVSTDMGERNQAKYYVWYLKTLFSHPAVEGINIWNLTDYRSWRDAPVGLLRSDMTPKSSYTALMDLIYNQWWTKTGAVTSAQGSAGFRGFYGDYKITVTPEMGQLETFDIKLQKNGENNFQLIIGNPADVNGDGKVNIKDIQEVIRCIINDQTCAFSERSDVNNDERINIKDIQEIIREIIAPN